MAKKWLIRLCCDQNRLSNLVLFAIAWIAPIRPNQVAQLWLWS